MTERDLVTISVMRFPRVRFSLRVLVLAVLTLGAGGALWHNFLPWRLERVYAGKTLPGGRPTFSFDGKWVMVDRIKFDGATQQTVYVNTLYNLEMEQTAEIVRRSWHGDSRGNDVISHFSENSKIVIAGKPDDHVIWDLETQTERKVVGPPAHTIRTVYVVWDDRHIRHYLHDGTCVDVDLNTNAIVPETERSQHVQFSINMGRMIVLDAMGSIRILEADTKRELHRIDPPLDWRFIGTLYLHGNQLFAEAALTEHESEPRSILWIDLRTPSTPEVLRGQLMSVSPDQSLGVLYDSQENKTVVVNLADFKEIYRVPVIQNFHWSQDSTRFYSYSDKAVYSAANGQKLYLLPEHCPLFSAAPLQILTDGEGLQVRDSWTGELLQTLPISLHNHSVLINDTRLHHYDWESGRIEIWKCYRPERWWGIAWLVEFWVTLVLLGVFAWTLVRSTRNV